MSAYERCSECDGLGKFSCESCKCSQCSGIGKVQGPCSCQTGRVRCSRCDGTGQIVVRKGFFSDKYGACYSCSGSRQVACPSCNGKTTVSTDCPKCSGRGRDSSCRACGGSAKIACENCSGSGRVESAWVAALRAQPPDKVRFEYDKRQNAIRSLQLQISRWAVELKEDYEEVQRDRREDPGKYEGDGSEVIYVNEGKIPLLSGR